MPPAGMRCFLLPWHLMPVCTRGAALEDSMPPGRIAEISVLSSRKAVHMVESSFFCPVPAGISVRQPRTAVSSAFIRTSAVSMAKSLYAGVGCLVLMVMGGQIKKPLSHLLKRRDKSEYSCGATLLDA